MTNKPPDDPKLEAKKFMKQGLASYTLGKYEEAISSYEKAIELDPKLVFAWNDKGTALDNLGKYEEAINAYDKAIDLAPKLVFACYNKGIALYNLGKYEEALYSYKKATDLDPNFVFAWNNKGIALANLGKHVDAISAYKTAIKLSSISVSPNFNLAELYLNLGDLNSAYETITKVPDDIKNKPMILKMREIIEVQLQNYIGAVKSFQEAIKEGIGNPEYLAWEAYAKYLYLESTSKQDDTSYKHDLMSILRTLEKISALMKTEEEKEEVKFVWESNYKKLSKQPTNIFRSQILYFKGFCYHRLGDHHTAVEKFKKSAKYASSDEKRPQNALHNVWKNNIRPSLWNWWLNSPTNTGIKRFTFAGILILIIGIVFLHPLIPGIVGKSFSDINWVLYTVFLISLIGLLLLPQIERIKATDFEIELIPPSTTGPALSNIHFERALSEPEPSNNG